MYTVIHNFVNSMKYVVALGFVAVIVGVFAYTALFESPKASDEQTAVTENAMEEQSATSEAEESDPRTVGKSTLEQLRLLGSNVECSIRFESESGGEKVEGTFFVADERVRGDFLTQSPDLEGEVLSSIILDGTMMYTWSEIEGEMYGMKMDTAMFEDNDQFQQPQQSVSMDTEVDYNCVPWVQVDNTVFVPPSDVLFQDFGDIIRAGMEYGTLYEEGAELPY